MVTAYNPVKICVKQRMDILVLEDDPQRHAIFRRNLIGTNVVIVTTVQGAIAELPTRAWDYVFLDHDLNGEQMVKSGEGTGYAVAEWLAANPLHIPPHIVVHSFNPLGAENIQKALPSAILAPGCWALLKVTEV